MDDQQTTRRRGSPVSKPSENRTTKKHLQSQETLTTGQSGYKKDVEQKG